MGLLHRGTNGDGRSREVVERHVDDFVVTLDERHFLRVSGGDAAERVAGFGLTLDDLRMALKLAVKRQELVDKILHGYGSIGNDTPINPSYPFYTEFEQREYDPEKAAFHLKKSGHDGPILLRTSENSFPGAPDDV